MKSRTACLNRLEAAFGIWPALARSRSTWLNCIEAGAVTPAQIIHLAAHRPEGMHGNRYRFIRRLAERLPDDIEPHPHTIIAAHQIHKELTALTPELERNQQAITALIEEQPYTELTELWRTVPAATTSPSPPCTPPPVAGPASTAARPSRPPWAPTPRASPQARAAALSSRAVAIRPPPA